MDLSRCRFLRLRPQPCFGRASYARTGLFCQQAWPTPRRGPPNCRRWSRRRTQAVSPIGRFGGWFSYRTFIRCSMVGEAPFLSAQLPGTQIPLQTPPIVIEPGDDAKLFRVLFGHCHDRPKFCSLSIRMTTQLRFLWVRWFACFLLVLSGTMAAWSAAAETPVSLAGQWRFEIAGANAQGFNRELPGTIHLPGTIDDAGLGPRNTNARRSKGLTASTITPGRPGISATSKSRPPGRAGA